MPAFAGIFYAPNQLSVKYVFFPLIASSHCQTTLTDVAFFHMITAQVTIFLPIIKSEYKNLYQL